MIDIRIEFKNAKQLQKALLNTESIVYRKTQQALNRTLVRSRTQMTNAIGEKLNLKKRTIRELIAIHRANKNTGLIGRLIVKNKPVALIEYNAKQNRKGVSFKVFRDRSRQLIRHAFIKADSQSRETVFKREGKLRLKIKPLYGTRVIDVVREKLNQIRKSSREFCIAEIGRLIKVANK